MPGIFVGVDGSPNSEHALRWAMQEAAVRHAPLTVIAVHEVLKSYWTGNPVSLQADKGKLDETKKAAEDLADKVASHLGDAKPHSITVRAVDGFAAQELIEASKDADLVVVGSRGGGGFARLMMGSVSSQVVHHSACPVVVIPHTEAQED